MKRFKQVWSSGRHNHWIAQVVLGFAALVGTQQVWAQDALADASGLFQRGATLAITVLAAAVVIVSVWVIIASMMQVARDRKTWGEVVGAVIGAGVIALVVGGLATFAVTQITAITA